MLTEEGKTAAVKTFKRNVACELAKVYPMHGYKELAAGTSEWITEYALLLHKRLNGQDIPLTAEHANGKLRERYRKR